ncbi:hypothetical protein TUBRATIS_21180 [Tubulinosema ratisbonensis]|uniref:Uncharacterized protein n=1 Tax=Tubulinosema ratisbonensis TaxID=291195 RepID=A0A437AJT0_9MICR|nr:hypothetical protein TUBRATIS_21180 [Tubulinosema ratisbonensis]
MFFFLKKYKLTFFTLNMAFQDRDTFNVDVKSLILKFESPQQKKKSQTHCVIVEKESVKKENLEDEFIVTTSFVDRFKEIKNMFEQNIVSLKHEKQPKEEIIKASEEISVIKKKFENSQNDQSVDEGKKDVQIDKEETMIENEQSNSSVKYIEEPKKDLTFIMVRKQKKKSKRNKIKEDIQKKTVKRDVTLKQ